MTVPLSRRMTPGLPRSGQRRLERSAQATSATSFLSVPSAFGLRAVGFEPVGDVMGCIGFQVTHQYLGSCGSRNLSKPVITMVGSGTSRHSSYLRQLRGAYTTALSRLCSEATAMGADGVVAIDLSVRQHDQLHEIVAVGTAVRSRGRTRPKRLFTTDLAGDDVAKLLLAGWTPVELHTAVQIGLRHNDWRTLGQSNPPPRTRLNVEVTGFTELRQRVVAGARSQLAAAVAKSGATGALLSRLETSHWHHECMQQAVGGASGDLAVQAIAIGTSVVRFRSDREAAPTPLTILPVTRTRG